MSGKQGKLIKDTLIYMIGNLGSKILSILIVPLYTFYFSPEELGDYDLIITTISLFIPIIIFQVTDGVYRWLIVHKSITRQIIKSGFRIIFRNLLIIDIIGLIFIFNFKYKYGLLILLLLNITSIFNLVQQIVRGLDKNKLYALSGIMVTIITITLNLIQICILKMGTESLILSTIIAYIIACIFMLISEKRSFNLRGVKKDFELEKELICFSIPLIPNMINWWIVNASDRYIIKFFLGSAANGIYSMAYKFPSLLQILCSMFNQAWQDNAIKEYSNKDRDEFYTNVFEKYYIFLFSVTLILIPSTKFIVLHILGTDYHDVWVYTPFLYLGTVFSSFASFYGTGYLSSKETKGASYTSLFGSFINIITNIMLIKFIGLQAASISTFIGFFVMWLARVLQTKRFFRIKINLYKFILMFGVTIIYSIVIFLSNIYVDVIMFIFAIVLTIIFNFDFIMSMRCKIATKIKNR